MERVEDSLGEQDPLVFNRNCYGALLGVGQDLVCMLSKKFPEEVKIKVDSQPESVGGKFSKRSGWPYII
jgi:hypothetical protein